MGFVLSTFSPSGRSAERRKTIPVLHASAAHAAASGVRRKINVNKGLKPVPADSRPPQVVEVGKSGFRRNGRGELVGP